MTSPDTNWIITAPGIMELPQTKFRIEYVNGASMPFHVLWNGKLIPAGDCSTLSFAKTAAAHYMQELVMMGFEV